MKLLVSKSAQYSSNRPVLVSVHRIFRNILAIAACDGTFCWFITIRFCTEVSGSLIMTPPDFDDPLTFLL